MDDFIYLNLSLIDMDREEIVDLAEKYFRRAKNSLI